MNNQTKSMEQSHKKEQFIKFDATNQQLLREVIAFSKYDDYLCIGNIEETLHI